MKPTTMLSFLIVLLTTTGQMLLAANNPPPPPTSPPDSFKLVFEWPNTFCLDQKPPYCQLHPQYFTLHGLWPQAGGQSMTMCPRPVMDDKILVANKADLITFWPDLKHDRFDKSKHFWKYQWNKHGRCSGMLPADYLTLVFGAVKKYDNVRKMLAKHGISPGPKWHALAQIGQAIFTETNLYTEIECKKKDSNEYLFQIFFCLTPQGQFKNCWNSLRSINCTSNPSRIFMPSPPPSS